MAIFTLSAIITTYLVVDYIKKKNRERAEFARRSGQPVEELDPSVVSAAIVLTTLPASVMELTLESLPRGMARSIVLLIPELPPISRVMVEKEKKRWLSHFEPPRLDLRSIEEEEPARLAAATVRLVLEDSN